MTPPSTVSLSRLMRALVWKICSLSSLTFFSSDRSRTVYAPESLAPPPAGAPAAGAPAGRARVSRGSGRAVSWGPRGVVRRPSHAGRAERRHCDHRRYAGGLIPTNGPRPSHCVLRFLGRLEARSTHADMTPRWPSISGRAVLVNVHAALQSFGRRPSFDSDSHFRSAGRTRGDHARLTSSVSRVSGGTRDDRLAGFIRRHSGTRDRIRRRRQNSPGGFE